ncbi:ankyrin repeat-containing domain protein [Microdochium trichocladiopsis]|uniref:Ankyrin repeat-containing domain protein n=1 Tax=Microdochium trichocladiopsis TaxID=1682393 RepID=A0A9P8XX54_9PEZI|nr:ankyrin repeat-containing domain protein [Microdochium trichocladiopsis]KAH7021562.1 ankyrin repeat-containing domain protein [Microdochium trichocladiopsis]
MPTPILSLPAKVFDIITDDLDDIARLVLGRTCRTLAGALQLYKIRRNPLAFVHAARLGPLSATELFKWSTRKDEVNQPKDYDYTRKYDLMDLDAEYDFIDPDFMYDHPHLDKYFWASAPLSPLAIASFHNSTEGIEVILSCGAQVDLNHKFVCNHDLPWSSPAELADGMPWLIESRPQGSTLRVDSAWTALEIAVCGGSVQAVEILLPHVKKVKAAQYILERSFLSAVAHRQFSIIEVLLQEVELTPQLGREALFYCVVGHSDGADEIAEMLVDAGVTIDAQAPAPWNILHISGIYGQFRVGKVLLPHISNQLAMDTICHWGGVHNPLGIRPLAAACLPRTFSRFLNTRHQVDLLEYDEETDRLSYIRELHRYGFSLDASGVNDLSPMELARHDASDSITQFLLQLGASDEDLGYAEERPMLPCGRCRLTRRQSDCDHGQWPSRRQPSRITDYELGNSRQQIWYFVELQEVRGERTRNAYVAETSLLKAPNFDLSFLQQYWKDHRVPIGRKKTIDPKHAVAFQGHLHIDSMGMHSRISPNGVDRFGNTKQVGTV